MSLGNLANAVFTRFEQAGVGQGLDEAIDLQRQALHLLCVGHFNRCALLNNLANAVLMRFEKDGSAGDLDEAIDLQREALRLYFPKNLDRSGALNNLANAILTRFEQTGSEDDLEEAIDLYRNALQFHPHGHPSHRSSLSNLANALIKQIEYPDLAESLDEVIRLHNAALILCPLGHPDRGLCLLDLSTALELKGVGLQTAAALEYQGVDLQTIAAHLVEADASFPELHPRRARAKSQLASVYLRQRMLGTSDAPSLAKIFMLFEQSSKHPTASLRDRVKFAEKWITFARGLGHESCLRAYTTALSLLNRVSVMTPSLDHQHGSLLSGVFDEYKSLVSDAAFCAIKARKLGVAVEVLEQGRSILWSRMRGFRSPLTALGEVDSDLANRFMLVSTQLEAHATSSATSYSKKSVDIEEQQRLYNRLSEEWDEVVWKIREVKGFENFLLPIPFSTLRKAAAEGPVIVVNISDGRSDAIIVLYDADPVLVPLPGVTPDALGDLASIFTVPRFKLPLSDELCSVLRELWRLIAEPVVEKLDELGMQKGSRIWWCPTSELCVLPIHAAGPFKNGEKGLPDRYLSSYVATLGSLIEARVPNATSTADTPSILVVAQPDESLPSV